MQTPLTTASTKLPVPCRTPETPLKDLPCISCSCLSTCFGVGGDEEVRGVRAESPDRVPVLGDAAHERNPSDGDEREASNGGAGLLDGFAVGYLFLL